MTVMQPFAVPEPLDMRRCMGHFLTGVAVVTTAADGEAHGMTISSLTSISLDPPVLMVSLNHGTRTSDALAASGSFAVSILGAKQEAVARRFAVRGGERFEGGSFDLTDGGLPVVQGALFQGECTVVQSHTVGDHQVYFGQVINCRDRDGEGLAFMGGRFGSFHDFQHDAMPWYF